MQDATAQVFNRNFKSVVLYSLARIILTKDSYQCERKINQLIEEIRKCCN